IRSDHGPPVERVILQPLVPSAQDASTGVLVLGLSPRLAVSDGYREFARLVAQRIASARGRSEGLAAERTRGDDLAALGEARSALFANVSHELRTPLTLMLGALSEVLAEPDAESA